MPARARPGSAFPRTGEQSLTPRMIPSIRYFSARVNATGVGFGVGLAVGAGVALGTGVAVGSTDGEEDGDGWMVGSGETTATLGAADGTPDGPGTGADDPHAARISVATSAVARTSLFMTSTPKFAVMGSAVPIRRLSGARRQ